MHASMSYFLDHPVLFLSFVLIDVSFGAFLNSTST